MDSKNEIKNAIKLPQSLLMVLLAMAFSLGLLAGRGASLFGSLYPNGPEDLPAEAGGEYRFIRSGPRFKPVAGAPAMKELKPIRYKVNALIESRKRDHGVSAVSVYFRDLHYGHRFSILGQEPLSGKNILRLPLMMAYFAFFSWRWTRTASEPVSRSTSTAPSCLESVFCRTDRAPRISTSFTSSELSTTRTARISWVSWQAGWTLTN